MAENPFTIQGVPLNRLAVQLLAGASSFWEARIAPVPSNQAPGNFINFGSLGQLTKGLGDGAAKGETVRGTAARIVFSRRLIEVAGNCGNTRLIRATARLKETWY